MESDRPSSSIEGLRGPASELPWSAAFVMQSIEVLPVARIDGALATFRPDCADSFIVGWPAGAKPEDVAGAAMTGLGLDPIVLHSTSWRHAGAEVVLTYLAVVPANSGVPESWEIAPVRHTEIARGGTATPPPVIGVEQVLEHALRHLAWLVKEDETIQEALPGWQDSLAGYVPEPFRALGAPG